ncbi:hypothetical protein [Plasmodium yoelii yoelii]|uniref:Uncharacterized protein n=1 Tax=Plasmodium yoelii yoelii TaxID=73239 RepID=Q7RL08_PLAYO|nr:hypothetical protein [Plasmodium yoelii yoelii]
MYNRKYPQLKNKIQNDETVINLYLVSTNTRHLQKKDKESITIYFTASFWLTLKKRSHICHGIT